MARKKSSVPLRLRQGDNEKKYRQRKIPVTYAGYTPLNMTKKMYREIKDLQMSNKLLIPKLSFARLVRDIIMDLFPNSQVFRIQSAALLALQESSEMFVTAFFQDSYFCTLHAKRVTLLISDTQLCRRLRGE